MAIEGELANGLIVGHAYSVTDVKTVCLIGGVVVRTLVSAGELSLSCARLLAG